MRVTGAASASIAARRASVTWKRSAIAANDGTPSRIETISPSRSMSAYSSARPAQLGKGDGDVAFRAREEAHLAVHDVGQHPHTVPLDLVLPAVADRNGRRGRREHGAHGCILVPMRAIWKGAVSFGLVNVPVRLFSATENHDVQFRQVHEKDGGRIKYQRVCSIDGEEVPYSDIAKGYEAADGQMVVLTDEDLKSLPTRSTKEISIEKFVPSEQIDPLLFDKSYYLEPDKTGLKPYVLLRDALEKADRMALVTVSVRTRMTLAVLRVRDGVIVLQTLLWADEVRAPEFESLSEETHATAKELAMASSLVDSLSGDYEPEEFEDDYAEAVTQLVATKIEGGDITETPEAKGEETEVVDLLAALQRSVDKAKAAKTGGSSSESGASDDRRGDEDRDEDRGEVADGHEGDDEEERREEDDGQEDAAKTTTKKAATKKAS